MVFELTEKETHEGAELTPTEPTIPMKVKNKHLKVQS